MLDRLLKEHDNMRESVARLRALIDVDSPGDMDAIATARWDIATRIMQHLAQEDRFLYTRLAEDARPHVAALGKRFQEDYAAYFAEYAEHAKAWTPERILAEWPEYRTATLRFLDLLIEWIEREERELYPIARVAGVGTPADAAKGRNWTRDAFAIKDSVNPRR